MSIFKFDIFRLNENKIKYLYISQNVINPICEIKLLNDKNEKEINEIIEEPNDSQPVVAWNLDNPVLYYLITELIDSVIQVII